MCTLKEGIRGVGDVYVSPPEGSPMDSIANWIGNQDDSNPTANPGMQEIQGDGIDNDCDGVVDEACFVSGVM